MDKTELREALAAYATENTPLEGTLTRWVTICEFVLPGQRRAIYRASGDAADVDLHSWDLLGMIESVRTAVVAGELRDTLRRSE